MELKFRAWVNNGMFDPFQLKDIPSLVMAHLNHESDIKMMQYTGCNDKNGFEIYEGDILKTPSLCAPGYILGVVEYRSDICCYVKRYGKKTFVRMDVRLHDVEVVSNMYEYNSLKHANLSCSLEAQGYTEEEYTEIAEREFLAGKCDELIKSL